MRNGKDWYLKYFVIGIFFLLAFIAYQLYGRNTSIPQTEIDCLKLGSDERAAVCLKLLKKEKTYLDFPLSYLEIKDTQAQNTNFCIQTSGTITNSYDQQATRVMLRIDFSKEKNGEPFHYEVFMPYTSLSERIQPNSSKTYTKCLNQQTYDAVKDINNWYYSVQAYEAKVYEE